MRRDSLSYKKKRRERVKYFQHERRNFVSPSDHAIFVLLHKTTPYNKYSFPLGVCLGLTSPQRHSLCQFAAAKAEK